MEKDVQHAVVASMEITEPGERPGLLVIDDDGVPGTDVDFGFAVWLTARGVAAWVAGMGIVWWARLARDASAAPLLDPVEAVPEQAAPLHLAMGMTVGLLGNTRKIMPATAMALSAATASDRRRAASTATLSREGLACR